MPAYVLVEVLEVMDQSGFDKYTTDVPAIVAEHGGRYVGAARKPPEVIEGDWAPLMVIIEFPDEDAVKALFSDPKYLPYKELRQKSFPTNIVVIPGVEPR